MRSRVNLSAALVFFGIALLGPTAARGDDSQQEALATKKKAKLESSFLKNGKWITDYDAARKEAKESQRLIFGYFTRSYAP